MSAKPYKNSPYKLYTSNSTYFDKMILNILPQCKVEPLKGQSINNGTHRENID